MISDLPANLDAASQILKSAARVAVMSGAGISAESGVPTFRGADGLWEGRRPEEVATPEAFARDPEDVWAFYKMRRDLMAPVQPNPAHKTLAQWSERFEPLHLITQNIDGLHQAAGSCDVLELHGSLWDTRCLGCGIQESRRDALEDAIPSCPHCKGVLRPAVVWFGEMLPPGALEQAMEWASSCEVFLCIGTSSLVQPAASLAMIALEGSASVLEINLEETPLTPHATLHLQGPAGEILPALDARMRA